MAVRAADRAMPVELATGGRSSLGGFLAVLRRFWWVVLAVLWLSLVGAAASAASTPTTYVGRSSLIVASNDRSPDQDAVLVQGYVAYFDDAAYQSQLLNQAGVHSSSSIGAQAAASSPILVVTASALDPVAAQANAVAVANAFSDDINETHSRATAAALATLQDQLDTALSRRARQDQAVIASLQDRIRELQSDQVNVLQVLQMQGGVSSEGPPWKANLLLGGAGGLVLGVLTALVLNALSRRVRSREDLANKVGLLTLVELPPAPGDARSQRIRHLANLLRAQIDGSGVITISQALDGQASTSVANDLAAEWAEQGFQTVLVRLGATRVAAPDLVGARRVGLDGGYGASAWLVRGPVSGMSVLEADPGPADDGPGFPAAAVADLLQLDDFSGKIVVVDGADVVRSAAAQAAGSAAGVTVLVVDPITARLRETREAFEVLRDSGAALLGAVLAPADAGGSRTDRGAGPAGSADSWAWSSTEGTEKAHVDSQVGQHNGVHNGVHNAAGRETLRPRPLVPADESRPEH